MRPQQAFTLLELLVTLAVITIVLSIAAPSLSGLMESNNADTASLKIQKNLLFARNHAATTLNNVTVCPLETIGGTTSCSRNWLSGIDIFIDEDGDQIFNGNDHQLAEGQAFSNGDTLTGLGVGVTFSPNGSVSSTGDFKYCSSEQGKIVHLYLNGRSEIEDTSC